MGLILILLLAGALRIYQIGSASLWMDELFSLASSTARYPDMSPLVVGGVTEHWPHFTALETARPWWQIWSSMREGTHPPLYIIALRAWREAVGEGDVVARLFSVVASLVAIALLFDVGRVLYGPAVGSAAALLFALAQPQVAYGQEARPYAMLLALGMGAWSAAARIQRDGVTRMRLMALGVCLLGMALTHYFSFGVLMVFGVWGIAALRGPIRRQAMMTMAAAGVVFIVLWGPSLWHQRHISEYPFLTDKEQDHDAKTMLRLDEVTQGLIVEERYGFHFRGFGWGAMVVVPALLYWRRRSIWPAAWFLGTVISIGTLDLARESRHLEYIRYTLLAGPGLYLMLAAVCLPKKREGSNAAKAERALEPLRASAEPEATGGRIPFYAGLAVVLLVSTYMMAGTVQYYRYVPGSERGDWRAMGALLRSLTKDAEPIVFATRADHEGWFAAASAMCLSHYAHSDRPVVVLEAPASEEILRALREHPRILFISRFVSAENYVPGFEVVEQHAGTLCPIQVLVP